MSRVGKLPVKVPSKVNVSIEDDVIVIKGPKGQLSMQLSEYVTIDHSDDIITFKPVNNSPKANKLFGTYRATIANMVHGVTEGFEKK